MKAVFADAHYWVALINHQDQSHTAAKAASLALQGAEIVTTEEVLTEMLAFFSERGRFLRQFAAATVRSIYANQNMRVLPQSSQSFAAGLALYEARPTRVTASPTAFPCWPCGRKASPKFNPRRPFQAGRVRHPALMVVERSWNRAEANCFRGRTLQRGKHSSIRSLARKGLTSASVSG